MLEWIENRRARGLRVSCKLIMKKAEVPYRDKAENNLVDNDDFKASRGWLQKFMKRNGLFLRRKTSVALQDPDRMVEKLVSYVIQIRRLQDKHKFKASDIIAISETPVWCNMLSEATVDATGKKSITLKSTGHEKARVSDCLAAKTDGTKLKHMVVFKGAKREVVALKQEFQHRVVVALSENGWMDTELTKISIWVVSVLVTDNFHSIAGC